VGRSFEATAPWALQEVVVHDGDVVDAGVQRGARS
jgi:hypothetical protein